MGHSGPTSVSAPTTDVVGELDQTGKDVLEPTRPARCPRFDTPTPGLAGTATGPGWRPAPGGSATRPNSARCK